MHKPPTNFRLLGSPFLLVMERIGCKYSRYIKGGESDPLGLILVCKERPGLEITDSMVTEWYNDLFVLPDKRRIDIQKRLRF